MNFHPLIEADSVFVADLDLCQVRLINNAKFPWVLLLPRREAVVEIIDLSASDQIQLMREISMTSRIFKDIFNPDKLNVAALGNVVPQLHIHVIARYSHDEAWPQPVWGSGESEAYDEYELNQRLSQIQQAYDIYKRAEAC
jgi:diadenosine tetraphosphate (Ap4A) HIT family hydrolase